MKVLQNSVKFVTLRECLMKFWDAGDACDVGVRDVGEGGWRMEDGGKTKMRRFRSPHFSISQNKTSNHPYT